MLRDLALLDACVRGEIAGAVRLYGFSPACLSLGRMQSIDDVNLEACARDGVDVVRRPSGGRAVLHDQEVTYSVVCRATDPVFGGRVLESCSRIHDAVAVGLKLLGVHTIGEQASDLVHIGLIALLAGSNAGIFDDACFNIPTLGALYKTAARAATMAAGKPGA